MTLAMRWLSRPDGCHYLSLQQRSSYGATRKAAARTKDALRTTIGEVLDSVPTEERQSPLSNCGYELIPEQLAAILRQIEI